MSSLQDFAGMAGSYLYCPDCRRQTIHWTAPGGSPICDKCGHVVGSESEDQDE